MLGPAQLLLILALFGVSEQGGRAQSDEVSYLVDLLSQSLLRQFLLLQLIPRHLELYYVQKNDLLDLAVVVYRLGEGVVVEIFEKLHPLIVQLVPISLELLQILHELWTKLALLVSDLQLLNGCFEIGVALSLQSAI